jgi:hypothetical protein
MFSFEFSLLTLTQKINEREYEFRTKGGRIMALGLIGGFIAKHFGYLDWSALGIVGASIGACLTWDVLTALLFKWRMARKMKWANNLYEDMPDDMELWLGEVETNEGTKNLTCGNFLVLFDSVETGKRIAGDTLDGTPIAYFKVPIRAIYDHLENNSRLVGVKFYHKDKINVFETEDLRCFTGVEPSMEPSVDDKIKEILKSADQKYMVGFVKETSFVPLYLTEDGKECVCLFANDDAVVAFREAFPTMKTGIPSFDDLDLVPVDLAKSYEMLKEVGNDTFALIYGDRCRYLPVEVLKQYL